MSAPQGHREAKIEEQPIWEPMDLQTAAEEWRKRAEALWKLSRRHEELTHQYRELAHRAEAMAEFFDGSRDWPNSEK